MRSAWRQKAEYILSAAWAMAARRAAGTFGGHGRPAESHSRRTDGGYHVKAARTAPGPVMGGDSGGAGAAAFGGTGAAADVPPPPGVTGVAGASSVSAVVPEPSQSGQRSGRVGLKRPVPEHARQVECGGGCGASPWELHRAATGVAETAAAG